MPTTAINQVGDRHYKTTVPLGFVPQPRAEGFGVAFDYFWMPAPEEV